MVRKVQVEPRRGYDLWAPVYDRTPNPVVALDERVMPGFIGPLAGEVVLDAGCGTGRHTVRLAAEARRVVAADFSPGMLARCRARLPGARVRFLCCHLEGPLPLASGAFDTVVCALVGEHIRDLPPFFAELARLLRPGGRLVFSVYHPSLALAGAEANFRSADGSVEFRLGAELHREEDYREALLRAGFRLDRAVVHRCDRRLARQIPAARKYLDQPLLLLLQGRQGG